MMDNPRVREANFLIAICFFGAFALAAIVFIVSLTGDRSAAASPGTGAPDASTSTSR